MRSSIPIVNAKAGLQAGSKAKDVNNTLIDVRENIHEDDSESIEELVSLDGSQKGATKKFKLGIQGRNFYSKLNNK